MNGETRIILNGYGDWSYDFYLKEFPHHEIYKQEICKFEPKAPEKTIELSAKEKQSIKKAYHRRRKARNAYSRRKDVSIAEEFVQSLKS